MNVDFLADANHVQPLQGADRTGGLTFRSAERGEIVPAEQPLRRRVHGRRVERLAAEHRAETEKLAKHLGDAYDELDKLRVKATAAAGQPHTDTGYGFPATMPLGDL